MEELHYDPTMRLQRFLARAGVASRRGSEKLMTAGRVRVNGQVVTELGSKVCPNKDRIEVDGREVKLSDTHRFLILNKPQGYITTMMDPQGRKTVAELVPTDEIPGLFPVGRLDFDTTGLLLFSTDGDVANLLLHPKHHAWKHYVALVKGKVEQEKLAPLAEGMLLDDGPCQPAREVEVYSDKAAQSFFGKGQTYGHSVIGLSIHEGRKHQVKRMLEAVGYPVLRLHRDRFATLELGDLRLGTWRELAEDEVAQLLQNLGIDR